MVHGPSTVKIVGMPSVSPNEYALFIRSHSPVIDCAVRVMSESGAVSIVPPPLDRIMMLRLMPGVNIISLVPSHRILGNSCHFEPVNVRFMVTIGGSSDVIGCVRDFIL